MRRLSTLLSIALILCACGHRNAAQETEEEKVWPLGFNTDTLFVKESKVASGEVFSKLFTRLGMSGQDAQRLVYACDSNPPLF